MSVHEYPMEELHPQVVNTNNLGKQQDAPKEIALPTAQIPNPSTIREASSSPQASNWRIWLGNKLLIVSMGAPTAFAIAGATKFAVAFLGVGTPAGYYIGAAIGFGVGIALAAIGVALIKSGGGNASYSWEFAKVGLATATTAALPIVLIGFFIATKCMFNSPSGGGRREGLPA